MEYSYKFRLYLNTAQQAQIARMFGCCRYVYNNFLALRESVYRTEQRMLNYNACATMLPAMKAE